MTKFEAFLLRLSLLKIWFIKNLPIFLELGIFTVIILVLTGQISEDTAVLGVIPGLKDLSTAIKQTFEDILSNNNATFSANFWSGLISTSLTILVAVGTLSNGLRRISLSDIKSIQLKRSLVKAGLFFNKEGKLVKRVEEATRLDLDGDNKIGDTEKTIEDVQTQEGGFFDRVKKAGEELATIVSVKIETKQDIEKIEEKAELKETKQAVQKIAPTAVNSAINKAESVSVESVKDKEGKNFIRSFFRTIKEKLNKPRVKKEKKVKEPAKIKEVSKKIEQPVVVKTEEKKKLSAAEIVKQKYGGK
jgi:hypothetical protein